MLSSGIRLGPYEILSALGAGGMGEVYKARDTRLNRFVAIKVLPVHLAEEPDLRERFQREAETIAKLNHPHICTLYDIGSQELVSEPRPEGSGGSASQTEPPCIIDYLVLEYLEGETLAARLKKGPLPLDQVLRYAVEISDALDKAHRAGVTHRDIKPGNIMLVSSAGMGSHGTKSVPWASSGPGPEKPARTKLLDFGLAKLKQDVFRATTPASEMPTVPGVLTEHGTLLGTLHYMAPEQVEGKVNEIDARTDIFAFGALVYEMATGKRAFPGETQASVIAKILEVDPPPMSSSDPPGNLTPPALDRVVKKCLRKDAEDRWQSARDVTDEIKWITEGGGETGAGTSVAAVPARPAWLRALPWAVAVVLSIVIGLAAWSLKPLPPQPVTRTVINLPPGQRLAQLDRPAVTISPDGSQVAYVASDGGVQQLYLRPMDRLESRAVPGTEGAVNPFFSPDGQWVGFFTVGGLLKKVSVGGGAAVFLGGGGFMHGVTWGNQRIVYAPNTTAPLVQLPEEGSATPQPLTRFARGEISHRWPFFLPGGNALLFAASPNVVDWGIAQIAVQSLGTGERRNLIQGGTQPVYAASGHLIYAQGGSLMAVPFDPRRLEVTGTAVPVLEDVLQIPSMGSAQYSLSSTGSLVYVPGGGVEASLSQLVWVDRQGREQLLSAPARPYYGNPRVSPDGRSVVLSILDLGGQVWIYDLARETLSRFTFAEGGGAFTPTWTPDGKRVAYNSADWAISWQPADGSGGPEKLSSGEYRWAPNSFSPDGERLAFVEVNPTTGRDIVILRLSDPSAGSGQGRQTERFLQTPFDEGAPVFSPDGNWLAYSSDETGRREIYVQPYPGPGGKRQISNNGGAEPVWNRNGRELFYRSGDQMMAVEIDQSRDREGAGVSFTAGAPRLLFEGSYLPTPATFPNYDVSPDGQRFLMFKAPEETTAPTQINVVLNWFEDLKQRVPVP